jgi:hypothetical protein
MSANGELKNVPTIKAGLKPPNFEGAMVKNSLVMVSFFPSHEFYRSMTMSALVSSFFVLIQTWCIQ